MAREITIIGGAGFVGTNLALAALERGHTVTVVDWDDRFGRVEQSGLDAKVNCVYTQGRALRDVMTNPRGPVVLLAALAHVDHSLYQPSQTTSNNVGIIAESLELCAEWKVPVLLSSSIEVYGGNRGEEPLHEEDLVNPLSPYASSKVVAEQLATTYRDKHGLDVSILRFTNLYGPWQAPDRVIPRLICQMLMSVPTQVSVGRHRDFMYVEDAVDALLRIIEGNEWNFLANLATGNPISVEATGDSLASALAKPVPERYAESADGRGVDLVATGDRLRAMLTGWSPGLIQDDDSSLRTTAHWYANNKEWWEQFVTSVRSDRSDATFLTDFQNGLTSCGDQ